MWPFFALPEILTFHEVDVKDSCMHFAYEISHIELSQDKGLQEKMSQFRL